MFTKYNGIEIPKNYSGNRFKRSIEETEMKTHHGSIESSTRTSVSPTYSIYKEEQSINGKNEDESITEYISEDATSEAINASEEAESIEAISNSDGFESDSELTEDINDIKEESEEGISMQESLQKSSRKPLDFLSDFRLGNIGRLFDTIKKDDLLLLSLVLLLASDESKNADVITLLSLLLLYRY